MSNYIALKALAECAYPGPWYVENGMDQVRDNADDFVCETGEDDPVNSAYIAAANPAAVLELIAEIERLKSELFDESMMSECMRQFRADMIELGVVGESCPPMMMSEGVSGYIGKLKAECEGLRKHAPHPEIIWCDCGDGHHANSYGAGFMAANEGVCENCDAARGATKEITCSLELFEGLRTDAACVDDLSAIIRQLVHSLRKAAPDHALPAKAVGYLVRKGLQGSPLRSKADGVEPDLNTHDKVCGWTAEDEASSRIIYGQWANLSQYVPWVEGGNSLKQDEARRMHAVIEGKDYCYGR
jgi:hypothetical protein